MFIVLTLTLQGLKFTFECTLKQKDSKYKLERVQKMQLIKLAVET